MKLCALVKIRQHPQPDGLGAQYGDVICFERSDRKFSDDEMKYFIAVPIDVNVPCGDNYKKVVNGQYVKEWNCSKCKNNDPELCEVQKYCRGEWTEGDIFTPPRLAKKFRYKISLDTVIEKSILDTAKTSEKIEEDKTALEAWAADTLLEKSVVEDKVILDQVRN